MWVYMQYDVEELLGGHILAHENIEFVDDEREALYVNASRYSKRFCTNACF